MTKDHAKAKPDLGFAAEHDAPIPYMERTRTYYLGLGYDNPYRWAHFAEVPFHQPEKPLAQSRLAVVTTASTFPVGPDGNGAEAKFFDVYSRDMDGDPPRVITHVAWDTRHADPGEPNCWFPAPALRALAEEGVIGQLAPRYHGMPTNRSQVTTVQRDCPALLERLREDGVEAVLLLPICPVCHQTLSLAARHLEAAGLSTVIMGCAKDVVEHVGVPRFLFSDFPLGNPVGRPNDPEFQRRNLRLALSLFDKAPAPRTTVQSPLRWSEDPDWKLDYSNIDRLSVEERARLRRAFDVTKAAALRKKTEAGLK